MVFGSKSVAAIVFAAFSTVGATQPLAQDEKPPKPSKAVLDEVAALSRSVTADFKDPDSAKFRNVRGYAIAGAPANLPKVPVLCGEVNAKNSYGAYIGYEPFVVAPGIKFFGMAPEAMRTAISGFRTGKVVYIGPEK